MSRSSATPDPVVMCLSGHDPSGGAGIQADIETINQLGGQVTSLISCLTVQNRHGLRSWQAVDPDLLRQQAAALFDDATPDALKLGALGSPDIADVAETLIQQTRKTQPTTPIVIDPVLSTGGGAPLSEAALAERLREQLLPLATIATPNHAELTQLVPHAKNPEAAIQQLLDAGCAWLLLTGTDDGQEAIIVHRLYGPQGFSHSLNCPRLPGSFHGSGCTLAAALALFLARGLPVPAAVEKAQAYCWQCLADAASPAQGQALPRRRPPP